MDSNVYVLGDIKEKHQLRRELTKRVISGRQSKPKDKAKCACGNLVASVCFYSSYQRYLLYDDDDGGDDRFAVYL